MKEMKHEIDGARENLKDVPQITPRQRIEMLKAMLAKQAGQQELPLKIEGEAAQTGAQNEV
jgi:hypothetical protein